MSDIARRWALFVKTQQGRMPPPREILRVEFDEDGEEIGSYDVPLESLDGTSPPAPGTGIKSFVPGREEPFLFWVPLKKAKARVEGKDLAVIAKAAQADTALYIASVHETLNWYKNENSRLMAERETFAAERDAAIAKLAEIRATTTDLAVKSQELTDRKEIMAQGFVMLKDVVDTAKVALEQRSKAKLLAEDIDGLFTSIAAVCGEDVIMKMMEDPSVHARMSRVHGFVGYARSL